MDKLTRARRSWNMSRIKSRDTKPELLARKALYSLGVRYRLHGRKYPGRPDIFISKWQTAIFIHGCFWHHHRKCVDGSWPKSNSSFWRTKIRDNMLRDKRNFRLLLKNGVKVVIIWECELTRKPDENIQLLRKLLSTNA